MPSFFHEVLGITEKLKGQLHTSLEQIGHGHHVFRVNFENAFLRSMKSSAPSSETSSAPTISRTSGAKKDSIICQWCASTSPPSPVASPHTVRRWFHVVWGDTIVEIVMVTKTVAPNAGERMAIVCGGVPPTPPLPQAGKDTLLVNGEAITQ